MSVPLMSRVWKHGPIDRAQRLLMLALADEVRDKNMTGDLGVCWPGTELLAKKSCMSVRSVLRTLKALEEEGWITVRHKSHESKGNSYELHLSRLSDDLSRDKSSRDKTGWSQVTNQAKSGDKPGNPPYPLIGRTLRSHKEPPAEIETRSSRSSELSDPIAEIYKAYPRRVGRRAALTAISAAIERLREDGRSLRDAQVFLYQAAVAFAQSPAGQNGEFTPHPATWFNKGRYEDDREEWQRPRPPEKRNSPSSPAPVVRYVDPDTVYTSAEYENPRGAA